MLGIEVDVAVIGASLAGASAALHLAQSGVSVAVFDKSEFPRRKACGEGLSIQGLEELARLGLRDSVESLSHVPFYGFRFFEERKRSEILLRPHIHGVGVRRHDLDHVLVDACQQMGVPVRLGSEVLVTRAGTGGFRVRSGDSEVLARYVVLATGATSSLPQALGVTSFTTSRSRCGLSVPLRHPGPHRQTTVDIFVDPHVQACLTPIDESTTTLSLFCSNKLAHRLTPAQRPRLINEVCERLAIDAVPCASPINVSGLGRTYRQSVHDGAFVVGDAFRQLDPIGGMGMTHALVSGRITAQTLLQLVRTAPSSHREILARHARELHGKTRALAGYTSLTYWSLSTRLGRKTLGRQKEGGLAREVLLSMHRPSARWTPHGLISTLLIQWAGLW